MPVTDEDIVRDLLHRYTDHRQPPESIATQVAARQLRLHRRRVASLTAAGAALATAAGVIAVVPGHASRAPGITRPATSTPIKTTKQPPLTLTAEQRKLYKLSSVAASQPPGQGRYAVMMTAGTDIKDTSVIDSLTGDMWSYQQGTDGTPSGTGPVTKHYSPTAAQFAAMPTDPTALPAALIAQWDAQNKPGPNPNNFPTEPIPFNDNDRVFQQATFLLWNPLVGPDLRSALYKVLATVPGVKVDSSARDGDGRRAVEISRTDATGLPAGTSGPSAYAHFRSDGITYATYEDPATGALLETAITYPPESIATPQDPNGSPTPLVEVTLYLSITWASTVPPNPYGG
jgi:hypothetical protein